jgi:hypothetical protein|tara:strand:+ start:5066 stop:5362 length:297 start_codon:yes stop_codon:yes gene_type:complete
MRDRDNAGGCTKRLKPTVEAPEHKEKPEGGGITQGYINQGRDQKAGGHKSANINSIRQNAVGELAKGVRKEKCGADNAHFRSSEYLGVGHGLLGDAKA